VPCCSAIFMPGLRRKCLDKILCISHSSLDAGAERAFSEMIKVLSIEGNSVYCIFPGEGPLIEKCRSYIEGYAIIPMPWWFGRQLGPIGKLKLLRKIFLSALQVKKFIRKTGPKKIIVNTIAIPGPAIAGRLSSVPVYWFLHELGNDGFSLLFGEKFSKRLVGFLAHRVVCNSQFTLSHYKAFIRPEKLSYAYQSVNIDLDVKKLKSSTTNFGLIGRLCLQKAQKEAVEAMLFMKNEQVKLWLIGSDKNLYASELKSWISENGLNEKVIVTGETNNIGMVYARLDALVVCSRNESLGRTTIEAMKYGLPIIAPNAFGHSELIQDGLNGLHYQLGDSADLASKMKILTNLDTSSKMGEYGKTWADLHFNDQRYAEMLSETLNS
jgi:glycosyltransferase involved in cell wall biosynthesis